MIIGQKFNPNDRNNNGIKQDDNAEWSSYGFSRDLSRIVFSKTFRRLGGKTQVFPVEMNEHAMNRMTHTLVVNNIAMDIATRLNNLSDYQINIDLIQAIANGHDVGHTPFGHAGERRLNSICSNDNYELQSLCKFKHNAFSVDILQNLDRISDLQRGYDLTWQTIDGILKHTELPELGAEAYGYILNNKFLLSDKLLKSIQMIEPDCDSYAHYSYPLTIEGQIVKAADEIAQNYHDMLDWSRVINHEKFVNCIEAIQLSNIIKVNMKNKSTHVSKFISLFFESDGELKQNKINDRYNRDYFAWGIKELMVNDVVLAIQKRINDDSLLLFDEQDKSRYVVKNLLFKLQIESGKKKVKIDFYDEAVRMVSENITRFGNELISSNDIRQYDMAGNSYIDKAFDFLEKDRDAFIYHCKGTILTVFSVGSLSIKNGNDIRNFESYDDVKRNIDYISGALFDCVRTNKDVMFFEENNQKRTADIFYSSIIKCLARMTDRFIKDLPNRQWIA